MTDDGLTGLGTIHGRAAKPVVEAVESTARKVLKGYRFKGFQEMVIRDAQGVFVKSGRI